MRRVNPSAPDVVSLKILEWSVTYPTPAWPRRRKSGCIHVVRQLTIGPLIYSDLHLFDRRSGRTSLAGTAATDNTENFHTDDGRTNVK